MGLGTIFFRMFRGRECNASTPTTSLNLQEMGSRISRLGVQKEKSKGFSFFLMIFVWSWRIIH